MERTAALVLTLIALPAIAGCLSGDGGSDAGTPTPVSTTPAPPPVVELVEPTLLAPVRLGRADVGAEPNIAVAPDGTIYVSTPLYLWRSSDGGLSYEAIGTPTCDTTALGLVQPPDEACPPGWESADSGLVGGGDGDLAIDATGRLHWLGLDLQGGPIPYQSSDDRGDTWTEPVDLSNETGSDREWIDARPEGTLYSSWRDSDEGGIIAVRTSFDHGETWGERRTMSADAVGGPIVHGPVPGQAVEAMATFSSGGLAGPGNAKVQLAVTENHGVNWTVHDVFTPPQSAQTGLIGFPISIFPVAAVDDAGTIYVVFSADQQLLPAAVPKIASRFGVFLTASTNGGSNWTAPVLLSNPDHAAIMPWIVAGAPGRIAVAWYENTAGLPHDNLPDVWNVMFYQGVGADGTTQDEAHVRAQLNTEPIHAGSICTSGTGCLITAGDRSLLDFFEVAITPTGLPVVAWAARADVPTLSATVYAGGVAAGTPLR
ncbi:MAG TPA: sialidase family protein [Candidatus Thermoplasmatota archaeon]|nr:sialidase family protein [Candidatus Thermoplasmatota archaeon]